MLRATPPIQSLTMTRNPIFLGAANSWNRWAKSVRRCELRLTKLHHRNSLTRSRLVNRTAFTGGEHFGSRRTRQRSEFCALFRDPNSSRQKKRPWLFRQAQAALRGKFIAPDPTMLEQRDCMLRHYDLVVDRFGSRKGTLLMSKYACYDAQGQHGAHKFRSAVVRVANREEFHAVVRDCFPRTESHS